MSCVGTKALRYTSDYSNMSFCSHVMPCIVRGEHSRYVADKACTSSCECCVTYCIQCGMSLIDQRFSTSWVDHCIVVVVVVALPCSEQSRSPPQPLPQRRTTCPSCKDSAPLSSPYTSYYLCNGHCICHWQCNARRPPNTGQHAW